MPARRSALLPDAPARDDQFRGHSGVADALAATVTGRDSGLVRLVGPFGSGKSTVVELARERLPGTARVVVYDAWTHHPDALRRTVLAAVLSALDPDKTLVPDLHGHVGPPRTRTDSTTTTGPGPWGVWAGLVAITLPLLVTFLAPVAGSFDVAATASGYLVRSVEHHAPLATTLTVVVLGLVAFWALVAREPDPSRGAGTLVVQRVDATVTETVTTGDLDADAFETHLADAVGAWTRQADDRTVVLVLDDIDRFPDRDRDKAHALLRSLHHVAHGSDAPPGLWVVVPDTPTPRPTATPTLEGSFTIDEPPQDWADKLFLAQFDIPPALGDATASHLEALLHLAFPDHPDHERQAAARQWLWAGRAWVPRTSVRFVNDLVALYRQHGDEPVPLRVQAAYLARWRTVRASEDDLYRLQTSLNINDWTRLASALHYGLPPDDALEAFVTEDVVSAIGQGDRTVIEDALASHASATLRVLDRHVHTLATGRVPNLIDSAAWVLGAAPSDNAAAARAWTHLIREAHAVERWDEVSPQRAGGKGVGLILVCHHRANGDLRDLWRALMRPLVEPRVQQPPPPPLTSTAPPTSEDISLWAEVVTNAIGEALRNRLPTSALEGLRVPAPPETYVAAVHAVSDDAVAARLPPEDDGVVEHLADQVRHRAPLDALPGHVAALLRVNESWDWTPLVTACRDRVQSDTGSSRLIGHSLSVGDADAILSTLLRLAHHPGSTAQTNAAQAFHDLDADGSLLDAIAHTKLLPPKGLESASTQDIIDALARPGVAALVTLLYLRTGITAADGPSTRAGQLRDAVFTTLHDANPEFLRGLAARFHTVAALEATLPLAPDALARVTQAVLSSGPLS